MALTKNRSNNKNTDRKKSSLLDKFFLLQLKDIYWAEKALTKALPEMMEAASSEELQYAFNDHLKQTERQIKRLDKVFEIIGQKAEGRKCEAMEGLIKEAKTIIAETKEGSMTRDAALIIAGQKVEHYEIASYGGLVQIAVTMKLNEAAALLDKTLDEEWNADHLLSELAETHINIDACREGSFSERNEEVEEHAV
jgi:ferritin-like metal-binding protein YciE